MNAVIETTTEPTLDEMREALAAALPNHAAFDGWGEQALAMAAADSGVDPAVARLAFPGGAMDMIDAWFAHVDRQMLAALPPERLATMKIRERITALVEARIDAVIPNLEALRRAAQILVQPQNVVRAAKLGWRAADVMWRAAGDTATDYNHYTKRALLSGVYGSTVTFLFADDSEGHAETRAFLRRRIDNVMHFEKAKARLSHSAPDRLSLARFLGRLRYPTV
jgi:ubiquinone biosynthesis protein COQ9